jgi:hypothetical protein
MISTLLSITRRGAALSLIVGLSFIYNLLPIPFAEAATLTSVSDTLSSQKAATASNHDIVFTTPTGITAGQTVIITFTGYANLGQVGPNDIDVLSNGSQINVGASNGATQWGVATSSNVLTLTAPSSSGFPTAGQTLRVRIGTNAVSQASGTQQITNPSAGSYTATIGGNQTDSGSFTLTIITNDTVAVSATVAQSISFSISTTTIYFGTLGSGAAKYASSTNASGDTASTTAHNLQLSTNAPSGYTITLKGQTLTNTSSSTITISEIGNTAAASSAGTAQFGIAAAASGGQNATVASPYATVNQYGYNATSSFATLASGTTATTNTTFNLTYLANIPATQAAGSYTTNIQYISTANF